MKQKHYIAGLYYRLSQEDERQGESVSIDNQRTLDGGRIFRYQKTEKDRRECGRYAVWMRKR